MEENSPIEENKIKKLPIFENYQKPKIQKKDLFWKMYAIFLTFILLLGIIVFSVLIKDGKLTPQFNQTTKIENEYEFNTNVSSPISNDFENNFNNTVEINFDLSDEFIDKICGNSS